MSLPVIKVGLHYTIYGACSTEGYITSETHQKWCIVCVEFDIYILRFSVCMSIIAIIFLSGSKRDLDSFSKDLLMSLCLIIIALFDTLK